MTTNALLFDRVEHLLNPAEFENVTITVVGLGSGGAPTCDHLVMNGFKNWILFDPDTLDPVNLVKHPRMRKDLGRPKVDIQKEWILDRNPNSSVECHQEDILHSNNFKTAVAKSDLVLSCPDTRGVREYISDICVAEQTMFVTASVFRTGIGGEIYSCIPGITGCYRCLELYSIQNNLNMPDELLELTGKEKERIYGLGDRNFHASGLSIDIQMISLIQARMSLSVLLRNTKSKFPLLRSNWVVFSNRPAKGIFDKHFDARQSLLRPQKACNCHDTIQHEEST